MATGEVVNDLMRLASAPTFGLDDLRELPSHGLRNPTVAVVDADRVVQTPHRSMRIGGHEVTTFLDFGGVAAELGQGATLMLPNLEKWHVPTARACIDLCERSGRAVTASCFLTPAGAQGLPLHRDGVSVIVHQIAGVKVWRLGPPSDPCHVPGPVADFDAELATRVLRAGDTMPIPAFQAHRAKTSDMFSFHQSWTFSLDRPFGQSWNRTAGSEQVATAAIRGLEGVRSVVHGYDLFSDILDAMINGSP